MHFPLAALCCLTVFFNAFHILCEMDGTVFVFMQIHTILEIHTLENFVSSAEMSLVMLFLGKKRSLAVFSCPRSQIGLRMFMRS